MKRKKAVSKKAVLSQMMELATQSVNDAVRLAYLSPEEQDVIASLDLSALTEFKRNSNGAVELKLTDRMNVLESLFDRLEEDADTGATFLQALENATSNQTTISNTQ